MGEEDSLEENNKREKD